MARDERRDQMVWSWLFLFFKVAFVHKQQSRSWAAILIVTDKQWWEGGKWEWWYIGCASSAVREKKSYNCSLKLSMLYLKERWGCKKKVLYYALSSLEYAMYRFETCCLPRNWKVFGSCSLVTWEWGHGLSDLCQLKGVKSDPIVPMDYWNLKRSQHPINRSQFVGLPPCPSPLFWIFGDFI